MHCWCRVAMQNLSWQRLFGAGCSVSTAGHQDLFFGRIRSSYIDIRIFWNHAILSQTWQKNHPVLKFSSPSDAKNKMFGKPSANSHQPNVVWREVVCCSHKLVICQDFNCTAGEQGLRGNNLDRRAFICPRLAECPQIRRTGVEPCQVFARP